MRWIILPLLAACVCACGKKSPPVDPPEETPKPEVTPLYQFWDTNQNEHIYTYGDGEPANWRTNPAFTEKGVVGYVATKPYPDTVPLIRAMCRDQRHYFYTTKPEGATDIERIEDFRVYVWTAPGGGREPVHACFLPDDKDPCFSQDLRRIKDYVDGTLKQIGKQRKLVENYFYVYPTGKSAGPAPQPARPVAPGGPPPQQPARPVTPEGGAKPGAVAFRGTADSFTAEFEKDEAAAKLKYHGETVEVTGPFHYLSPNPWAGEPEFAVQLRGVSKPGGAEFARVICKITDKLLMSDARLRSLARGQSVTIRGKLLSGADVGLTDCTVVAVGPSTAIPTTLEEIEAELGKKPGDLGRFKDRDVIVRVKIGPNHPDFGPALMNCTVDSPPGAAMTFKFTGLRMGDAYDKELTELEFGSTAIFLAQIEKAEFRRVTFLSTRLLKALPDGLKLPERKK
jgi:hypothetical protein